MNSRVIVSRQEAKNSGSKQYFTGLPCKNGHVSARMTINSLCMECNRVRMRASAARDPEGTAAKRRKRYLDNIDSVKITQKRYREANREAELERQKRWQLQNPEKELAKQRRYRENNSDRIPKIRKRWRDENPGKTGLYNSNRRGLKNKSVPDLPSEFLDVFRSEIEEIYVEARRLADTTGESYDVDHIFPLSKGGVHAPWNLRILPASINRSKYTKIPKDEPINVLWHGLVVSRIIKPSQP